MINHDDDVDWSEKKFLKTLTYTVQLTNRYLDTISCDLTIFNFIHTTGQHYGKWSTKLLSGTEMVIEKVGLSLLLKKFLLEQLLNLS